MVPTDAAAKELADKVRAKEKELGGTQLTFCRTPADAPVGRKKTILFYGVVDGWRQYAFATEDDREQFAYDRRDTLFTVNRDLRERLGLDPPRFVGTVVKAPTGEAVVQAAPAKKKNRFRK